MFHSIIASFIIPAFLAGAFQDSSVQRYPLAPDHSLKAATYIQKGLPAHDRPWSGQDYQQAAAVLQVIALADATQLPRYGSPISGDVFARIVSLDNLKLSRDRTVSQALRLQAASLILMNMSQVTMIYASATTTEKVFDSESVELLRFTLETCHDIGQLTEAVLASAPTNNENRKKGLDQVGEGLAQVVNGSLITLTEKKAYRTSELIRLAQTIETTLPTMMALLPAGTQQEIPVRMKRLIEQESDAELKEQLARVAAALNKAKKAN